jgi:magnesium transporter
MQIFSRRHAPGTAPGTLGVDRPPTEPVRSRLTAFDVATLVETEVAGPEEMSEAEPGLTRWLDVEGHDLDLISALGAQLVIHPLALEDVLNVGQRTKSEDFGNSLFVVMDHFFFESETGSLTKDQVSLVIMPDGVLSVRERRSDLFEPVRERLRVGKPRLRDGGSGYLAYALMDTVVDHLFPVLEAIGDRIEDVEDTLLDGRSEDLSTLHELKRELLVLRKSLWPLRDMLNGIHRNETDLFDAETRLYLRDVVDHATRAVDIVETLREMVSSLMDLYLTSLSNRMNETMKVLTIIATIFIPLSFIAGLYGMNFERSASPWNMPELGWAWGYPFALAMMASVAIALLVFFRRKGWI